MIYKLKYGLIFLLVLSCSTERLIDDEFFFIPNSEIKCLEPNEAPGEVFSCFVAEGDNLVFEFRRFLPQDPNLADSGGSKSFVFEVAKEVEEFEFVDDEILSTNAFYAINVWVHLDDEKISKGVLKGNKINEGQWFISIDVRYGNNSELKTNGVFELE